MLLKRWKNVEIFDEIGLWNASKYANSQSARQICCISPRTMLLEIRSARSEVWRQIYFEKPPKFWCFSMYSTTVGVPIVNSQCCIRSGASFSTNFLPKHSSKKIRQIDWRDELENRSDSFNIIKFMIKRYGI